MKLLRSIYGTLFWIIGVIKYHGNQQYIVTNTNGNTNLIAISASHPQNLSSTINYQNQVVSTMPSNTTSANLTQTTAGAVQGGTSITYSNQGPPPAYQEKEEEAVEIS